MTEADRAERAGDPMGAALALRRHLERHAEDGPARLRFARLLIAAGERAAARQALAPLERRPYAPGAAPPATPVARSPGGRADVGRARRGRRRDRRGGRALGAAAGRRHRRRPGARAPRPPAAPRRRRRPPGSDRSGAAETLVPPKGWRPCATAWCARSAAARPPPSTWRATRRSIWTVALKVLHPQLAGARQSEALARFFAGARLSAGLRHPGRGGGLRRRRAGARAGHGVDCAAARCARACAAHPDGLPAAEVAATARGLLATLAFLHGRGIVHGDLKPSNLLLRAPGEVVLADFGAAALSTRGRSPASRGAGGTPLYLAPEQFRGAAASRETDLYAAGAILWEAATGRSLRTPICAGPPAPWSASGRRRRSAIRREAAMPGCARASPPRPRPIVALLDPSPSARRPWERARPSTL